MNIEAEAEAEARKLRDAIYGPCSEGNWENCKHRSGTSPGWIEDIQWLRDHQPKEKK